MSVEETRLRFYQKVAIVTGGCDGVGRGCVDILDELGSNMTHDGPGKIIYIHCDMKSETEIKEAIEKTVKMCGKIDCLVNNVGSHPGPSSIDDITVQGFRDLLEINLISHFTASKYTLPHLRVSNGCIVNISSNCATKSFKNSSSYGATKGGVTSLTKALAIDEAKYGVRVNSIAPGPVNTRLLQSLMPAEEQELLAKCNHLNRLASPREIGQTCLYLATDATFTTGMEIMVTGGAEIGYGVKGGGNFV
ncbi:17-beta-hydroxysteroid dehydrogenase 14-like isoform X2 [Ruditapes philippinarum]|uniref:17-beta-hydroxysteroid dehydrogenase 14-like isoform X2 n=1 Tax=Ruditapes philippinarum TaxID=129788 RepID=UPI00295B4E5C|nr:17-beta-hydroxysteroid dehydrogenase 14-like isoform X2 [Ruditapes philippinarum]